MIDHTMDDTIAKTTEDAMDKGLNNKQNEGGNSFDCKDQALKGNII